MRKTISMVLIISLLFSLPFTVSATESFNQLILSHRPYATSAGQWNMSFNTVGTNMGRDADVWITNTTGNTGTLFIDRRTPTGWQVVLNRPIRAFSDETTTWRNIVVNTEHRVRIEGTRGSLLSGMIGLRQGAIS